jgi:hypothetical protein
VFQLKLEPHFSTLYMYSLALAVIQIHPNLLMVKASSGVNNTTDIEQGKPSCCRDAHSEGTASYSKGKGKQRSPKTETEQNRTEQAAEHEAHSHSDGHLSFIASCFPMIRHRKLPVWGSYAPSTYDHLMKVLYMHVHVLVCASPENV